MHDNIYCCRFSKTKQITAVLGRRQLMQNCPNLSDENGKRVRTSSGWTTSRACSLNSTANSGALWLELGWCQHQNCAQMVVIFADFNHTPHGRKNFGFTKGVLRSLGQFYEIHQKLSEPFSDFVSGHQISSLLNVKLSRNVSWLCPVTQLETVKTIGLAHTEFGQPRASPYVCRLWKHRTSRIVLYIYSGEQKRLSLNLGEGFEGS